MNIYLEKLASTASIWRGLKNTRGTITGSVVGATAGAYAGYKPTKMRDSVWSKPRKKTKTERIMGSIGGGLAGAYVGGIVGLNRDLIRTHGKNWRSNYAGGHTGASHGPGSGRTIQHFYKDLEVPSGGFKTKAQAKHHFRVLASKYHPDKHTGASKEEAHKKMSKINAAWNEFKKHPDGFEKLANSYLEKIASVMAKTPFNDKDMIKNKPLVEPKPPGTFTPKKKPAMTGLQSKVL